MINFLQQAAVTCFLLILEQRPSQQPVYSNTSHLSRLNLLSENNFWQEDKDLLFGNDPGQNDQSAGN
jgi:hypothetical protein